MAFGALVGVIAAAVNWKADLPLASMLTEAAGSVLMGAALGFLIAKLRNRGLPGTDY